MMTLTAAQRQHLKALAHSLSPVVLLGEKGLTEAVLKEIGHALKSHELIKIKAVSGEKTVRENWLTEICTTHGAAPVQHIGKTLIIYKPAETPVIKLPG